MLFGLRIIYWKGLNKMEAHCLLKWNATVGECATWDEQQQNLYWVDIPEKKVHCFDPQTNQNKTFAMPGVVPCLALRSKGGLLVTLKNEFAFFDPDSGELQRIASVEENLPHHRINDGKCDSQGRFWAGTMNSVDLNRADAGLYMLDEKKVPIKKQDDVICGNGLGWSPDSRTFYFTESFRYSVFAFDFEASTGEISNRRLFAEIKEGEVFPDGLTVDSEGFVWICVYGSSQIRRYDPKGRLERTLHLPVPKPTSCAFGGEDLKTLFVTTAREKMSASQLNAAPLSGSLFAVETDIRGLPTFRFQSEAKSEAK
jgi:sugar lactone lactonase YvrE